MEKVTYEHLEETVYKKTLSNGLTLFLLPKNNMAKSYALFMTDYGSMHNTFKPLNKETAINVPDGIAHFLEHKLFEKKDRDVFTDFVKHGASPNAYTSFTKTAYLFSTTENVKQNVEILLDFVQEPYFSDESVEKEKGIIAQEIKMYDDQPDWRSFMGTIKNMYHQLPINIDIAGTVESIQAITKEDLYTCYETFYHPSNMALFVIGNFSVDELYNMIEKNQENKQFANVEPIEVEFPDEPSHVVTNSETIELPVSIPKVTIGIKEYEQLSNGAQLVKRELIQQMVLDYLFSPSGTFYETLYEEQLIDDSFEYSTTIQQQFNFSLISSNTENPNKFEERIKQLLFSTSSLEIDVKTFNVMKKKKIGELLRSMNSLESIANEYLQYYFAEFDYFTLLQLIESLTVEDINNHFHNWIDEKRLTTFIVKGRTS